MRKNYSAEKSRKIAVASCLACASIALNACGKDDIDAQSTCSETACKDANILAVCDSQTGISIERECAFGCENNACKPMPEAEKCTKTACKNAKILAVCDSQTGISIERECAFGCENDACKPMPEAVKCTKTACKDANILAVCDSQTGISIERECADGCENNACKPKSGEDKCQDGHALCSEDGAYAEKCDQGALWREKCENGCDQGACKKQTIYKSNEKCDSETFKAYCLDDLNMYAECSDSKVYYNQCESGESCLTSQDGTLIGCYDKTQDICGNIGETATSCREHAGDWISGSRINAQCALMSDGTGRLAETAFEHCKAGCAADGINCAPETAEDGKTCSSAMQANCAQLRMNCAVFSGVAECYRESSDCGEVKTSCARDDDSGSAGSGYVATSCIAADDGKTFIEKREQCPVGCAKDGTRCAQPTADGKTCSPEAAEWCKSQYNELCAIYRGDALCYGEAAKCDLSDAGDEIIFCNDNTAYYFDGSMMDDGLTCVYRYTNKKTCDPGYACVENAGCLPLKNSDGTCNEEANQYCAGEGFAHCAFISGNIACYNNADVCGELYGMRTRCGDGVLSYDICLYADDNKTLLYNYVSEIYCDNGCDPFSNTCGGTYDVAEGLSVSPEDLSVYEGGSGVLNVAWKTQPSAKITLTFKLSDASRATADPATITFTPNNYATAQSIKIAALRNGIAGDDADIIIQAQIASDDATLDGLRTEPFPIHIIDTEGGAGETLAFRAMAANITTGNFQSYDPGHGIRIFKAVKPDIVMIQEFNYGKNADADIAAMVQSTFGADYSYHRGRYLQNGIPNGVISRFPIIDSGYWKSNKVDNRDWDWAVVDLPGSKELLAVSVHLHTKYNASEIPVLTQNIESKISADAAKGLNYYVMIGGDFNSEAVLNGTTDLERILTTSIDDDNRPTDQNGNSATNESRKKTYDILLADQTLHQKEIPAVIGRHSYPHGHVFDSRVYSKLGELDDVSPVQENDSDGSAGNQHMAVIRDFEIVGQ